MSHPDPEFSVEGARRAAQLNELDVWVCRFLSSPGSDNADLGRSLTEEPRWWTGPMRLSISSLHRLVGPSQDPVLCPLDDEHEWRDDLQEMVDEIVENGWEPPPVVVTYRDGQLVLEDGNHRVEGLRRAGRDQTWAVVGFENEADRDRLTAG